MKDYLTGLLLSTLAVFAPIKAMVLTTLLLIAVDLITGLLAAKKRKEKLSSAGIRRTFTKFTIYMTGILVGFLAETYMLDGFIAISKIAAGLISIVEMKSILENLDTMNGSPLFKALINKLGSVNDVPKQLIKEDPVIKEEAGKEP